MFSKFVRPVSMIAAALSIFSVAPAHAQAEETVVVKDFDMFVDLPTAFAFIKLPAGWKFVGKLDSEQLRHLPDGTLTSLLPAEEPSTRFAVGSKVQMAPGKS